MGKKDKSKKKAKRSEKRESKEEPKAKASTFDAVEAMSSSDEGSIDQNNKAWNNKAASLEKLIKGGAYDKILAQDADSDDASIEEVVLGDGSESVDEKAEEKPSAKNNQKNDKKKDIEDNEEESDEDDEDDASGSEKDEDSDLESDQEDDKHSLFDLNSKALLAKTEELLVQKKGLPWVEKFEVFPSTPLPFGTVDQETGTKIEVHDDLKREVAFYDVALEAVEEARAKCKENTISFSRPEDFFAGAFCMVFDFVA